MILQPLLKCGAGYALTYLCQLKLPDPVYAVVSTAVDPSLAEEPHNVLPSRRARRSGVAGFCDRVRGVTVSMCRSEACVLRTLVCQRWRVCMSRSPSITNRPWMRKR